MIIVLCYCIVCCNCNRMNRGINPFFYARRSLPYYVVVRKCLNLMPHPVIIYKVSGTTIALNTVRLDPPIRNSFLHFVTHFFSHSKTPPLLCCCTKILELQAPPCDNL